jgi:glycosyltransferase involved in cell wall biosynthesis
MTPRLESTPPCADQGWAAPISDPLAIKGAQAVSSDPNRDVDVLMITYNRPDYTRMTLPALLESADVNTRVWLWHNGDHEETLEVAKEYSTHPAVYRFHHSVENQKLRGPTNWLFQEAEGAYVSKVDDDCFVPEGWLNTLRKAHEDEPRFGVLGCWRFLESDYVPELAERKIAEFRGGHRIMQHPWVEGSGYLMKREALMQGGLIGENDSFTKYCLRLALKGWVNGWYYPFLWQEHLDDPRAPRSLIKTNEDFLEHIPLSAGTFSVNDLKEWDARLRYSARSLLAGPVDPRYYVGWRARLRRLRKRVTGVLRGSQGR